MQNKRLHYKGYTLVEILIVIAIFGVVSTIILSIIYTSLRGSRKSDLIISLRQNGNAALTQMIKNIRYAKSLDLPATCFPTVTTSSITISSYLDDEQTTLSCPFNGSPAITSNSAELINVSNTTVTNCSFVCSQKSSTDWPSITIQFTLSANSSNSLVESTGSVPFQSTVTMRNYHP